MESEPLSLIVPLAGSRPDSREDGDDVGSSHSLEAPILQQSSPDQEKTTVLSTALNLTNTLVGAGLLAIPFSIRAAGFSGVFVFALVTALLGWCLAVLLCKGAMHSPKTIATLKRCV
jgi:solute carrier family 38 (sodium-coupled neutral amino acid transporter), member 11